MALYVYLNSETSRVDGVVGLSLRAWGWCFLLAAMRVTLATFTPKKKKKRSYLFNSSPSKCIYQAPWNLNPGVGLNPSTIDGWGEGAWRSGRRPQAILEGNHDNPESGTHQALSHWESQGKEEQLLTKTASREEGGLGAKNIHKYCRLKQRKQNDWLLWKHCKITKALVNPET